MDSTIAFSAWQVRKIRGRLLNYLDQQGTPPRALPLTEFLRRMERSAALDQGMFVDDEELILKHETLRQWLAPKSKRALHPMRIKAIKDFLIGENVLSEFELTDDFNDGGEMSSVIGFLGQDPLNSRINPAVVAATYRNSKIIKGYVEAIDLSFELDPSGTFFKVEEHFVRGSAEHPEPEEAKDKDAQDLYRRGYAFFATRLDLLHVFVRGGSQLDRIHYTEIDNHRAYEVIEFLRAGDRGGISTTRDPVTEEVRVEYEIFAFTPITTAP